MRAPTKLPANCSWRASINNATVFALSFSGVGSEGITTGAVTTAGVITGAVVISGAVGLVSAGMFFSATVLDRFFSISLNSESGVSPPRLSGFTFMPLTMNARPAAFSGLPDSSAILASFKDA